MQLITNPYVAGAAAIAGVGVAIYKATNMALDWEKGMAKVNVTAQLTQTELKKLSNQLLDIGAKNVAPLEEIPDAFNKIISAGLDVKQSLAALDPTLKAAKAGFVDVETVATAGVNVMNSSGKDINTVYDVLFATLNKGAAEMGDIANYLPKIVPAAKQAGFSLEETAGAFAFFTAQGQKAEASTTLLENAFKVLADPEKAEKFKKLGVNLYNSSGKMLPLIDIVKQLSGELDGLTDEQKAKKLKSLGLDQQAASAFAIMTQDVSKLNGIIDSTTNSQGSLNRAYKDSMTATDSWKIVMNMAKREMIKIGEYFLPILSRIGEGILGVINWFKNLYNESTLFRDLLSFLATGFEWTFKIATIGIRQVWNIIKNIAGVFSWLIGLIPGFGGGFEQMYLKVKPYLMTLKSIVGQIADILFKIVTFDFAGAWKSIKSFKIETPAENRKNILAEAEKLKLVSKVKLNEKSKTIESKSGELDSNNDNITINDTTDKVTGSAQQIRNITVNIDSFNKGGINTQNTELKNMSSSQIEDWFNNSMLRMIRNLEMSY